MNDLEALPLPTVAAINGHALGGGLELVLACDFRFMGEDSGRFGLPEVRLGLIPSLGGTQRLPLLVGKARAVEMMFKGLQLTPREAERVGLVNEVFSQEELYAKSLDYTTRLARQATRAIARIKRCVNTGLKKGFARGLAAEHEACRYPRASPWHFFYYELRSTPFGRGLIHPRASPWNSALRVIRENIVEPDAREGVAAFLEGRKAAFKGVAS